MSPTIDELVARTAPITDDELGALGVLERLERLEGELSAAIMREPRGTVPPRPHRRGHLPRRRGRVAAALAAAVCAAVVLAATSFLGADRGTQRAWAAEAVRVANAVPRLLIDAPGWQISRADQFSVELGEMTFADGARRADLKWSKVTPGALLEDGRKDDPSASVIRTTQVLGHRALVYRVGPGGADDYIAGVWQQGGYVLELRPNTIGSQARNVDALVTLLHGVRAAGVDEWLSAMPASVVLPADRETAVRAMLADIPVPAGFDAASLNSGDAVRDRYQLGARVAGAAACAWIEQWADATSSGDDAAAARAVRAMRGSRDWAILREMQAEGAYPQVLWRYADAIAGSGATFGGKGPRVQDSYSEALGCEQLR